MKYTKDDVLKLKAVGLRFTKHAVEQMRRPDRNLTESDVQDALVRDEIHRIERAEPCDKLTITTSEQPYITVVVGMCPDGLVVITVWRGLPWRK